MFFVEGPISFVHPPWRSQWDLGRLPGNWKGSRPPTSGNNWPRRWVYRYDEIHVFARMCTGKVKVDSQLASCKTCVILCGLCSDLLRASTCCRKCVQFQTTRRFRSMTWQLGFRSKLLRWDIDIDFPHWKLSAYSGLGIAGLWELLVGLLASFGRRCNCYLLQILAASCRQFLWGSCEDVSIGQLWKLCSDLHSLSKEYLRPVSTIH